MFVDDCCAVDTATTDDCWCDDGSAAAAVGNDSNWSSLCKLSCCECGCCSFVGKTMDTMSRRPTHSNTLHSCYRRHNVSLHSCYRRHNVSPAYTQQHTSLLLQETQCLTGLHTVTHLTPATGDTQCLTGLYTATHFTPATGDTQCLTGLHTATHFTPATGNTMPIQIFSSP